MSQEKRKSRRRPVCYMARLELRPGRPVGCVLSDISDTGARLDVPYPDKVPERFLLWLTETGSARRTCQVVWRKSRQIGVRFERRLSEERRAEMEPIDAATAKRAVGDASAATP